MKTKCAAFLSLVLAAAASCGDPAPPESGAIHRVRAFALGGTPVAAGATGIEGNIADEVFSGQIAVTGLLPSAPARPPVVMLPGFGLAAAIYLETPDGREGWAMDAVRRGYPVYLVDPAHSARAGFDPTPYTNAQRGAATESPVLFTWGRETVWRRWGLGEEYPVPFADGRFPYDAYDDVVRAFTSVNVGEIAGEAMIRHQLDANVAALVALLDRIGPSILLVHSAAGVTAFEVARREPDRVLAVISIEPVGCPTENLNAFLGTPVVSMFGDHMEVRPQMPARRDECRITIDYLAVNGTPSVMFDLPAMGIAGNSHLLMSEHNSAALMTLMLDWLEKHGP